jgi:hypothetical protein
MVGAIFKIAPTIDLRVFLGLSWLWMDIFDCHSACCIIAKP